MEIVFVFLIYGAVIGVKIYLNVKNGREWDKGLFERDQPESEYSADPLLEAYIDIGALMIRKDKSAYREKILYLNSYFSRNFPDSHYDFGRSFTDSLKNPISTKTLARRLNRKLPERSKRLQILYFLAGLASVDGSMSQREVELLKEMNVLLNLSAEDIESVIAMYKQQSERAKSAQTKRPIQSAIELAAKIIGVSKDATIDEIKNAYRSLAKLHHPDRFALDSIEQQKIANERFIEIQKAYEVLTTR